MNDDEGKIHEMHGHLFPIRILIGDKLFRKQLKIEKCKKEISLIKNMILVKLIDNIL
ncbi:hypothetical protein RhiirA5_357176, partial [Rhizophagus irregularis]